MGSLSPEQRYRIVEPLVAAGLEPEQIRDLMFRLAFTLTTGGGNAVATSVTDVVGDQPAEVQTAWMWAIGRMIMSGTPGPAGL